MTLPARPTDAPLPVDYFSGGARLTDGRLRAYLNSLEAQVDALVGEAVSFVVDDAIGSDDPSQDGSAANPLATIVEAERRAALIPDAEVDILVRPHSGVGYAWPTFRPRLFLDSAPIWVRFTEFAELVAPGDTGQGGSGTAVLVTSGGLTPDALEGKTVEILDGAAAGDRRSIRDNTATNITPNAHFSASVLGSSYRVIEPDPGNIVIPTIHVPMVHGMGVAESIPVGDTDFLPGVRLVNAILDVPIDTIFVVDARFSLFGCELDDDGTLVRYHGSGQVLFGRSAWNRVGPPSAEAALSATSWVGWGCSWTGGHFPSWTGAAPYVSGFVNALRWIVFGGDNEVTGHIRGPVRCLGENNSIDTERPRLTFGRLAPFVAEPRPAIGKITNPDASLPAVSAENRAYIILGDEVSIESTITNCIRCDGAADIRLNLDINIDGTNGGHGATVRTGARLLMSASGSFDINGTLAGDELQVGERPVIGNFVADLNNSGDFVSAGRAFWDSGLAVSGHTVTLSSPGAVLAVEATTGSSTGPKRLQFSAAPPAGFVRVEYDASGVATLTFNATDAITEAAVMTRPEDDGSVAQAL
jgi:hypothetical protein